MNSWMYLFEDKILGRGLSYTDLVEITSRNKGKVTAKVYGTDVYTTEITFDDGLVDDMHCTCPYFDTDNCKHLAALLFVLEDEDGLPESDLDESDDGFEELFNSLSDDELRQFLFDELEGNPELRNTFKLKFSNGIDPGHYRSKLSGICFEDENRYLINGFLREDMEFLMEKQEYELVLDLLDDVFPYIMDWWNYWEDYGSDGNMERVHEIAFRLTATAMHDDVFEWLSGLVWTIQDDHMDDLTELYCSEFTDTEELEYKQSLFKRLYDKTHNAKWIRLMVDVMEKLGRTEEEIGEITKAHLDDEKIMDYCLASAAGEEKEKLLLKAISQFTFNEKYKAALKDYYSEIGYGGYLDVLEDLVLTCPDIEYFREFRTHYPGNWPDKRREILENYKDSWFLNECYAEEKMYDELIGNIRNLYVLNDYKDLLAESHSEELIGMYEKAARNMASVSGPPKHYAEIAEVLETIHSLPGGEKRACEIKDEFMITYKRRPRMLQALRELKF